MTNTQTMLHMTSVTVGHIFGMHRMQSNNNYVSVSSLGHNFRDIGSIAVCYLGEKTFCEPRRCPVTISCT